MRTLFLLSLGLAATAHAAGFANGVKIGEVTADSAVLWARLTVDAEAGNRVANWTAAAPNWTVPGQPGRIRFAVRPAGGGETRHTPWTAVTADSDCCHQARIDGLAAATRYEFTAEGEADGARAELAGSFTTAPAAAAKGTITAVISTCQEFETRDDLDDGHRIYRSMVKLDPDFFVQTGDTVYYDRKEPLAKTMALARYRWNRMYALPSLREFHRQVPSYWMHDDHDVLKNDAWPGQTYGELTWDQGLKIWGEQVPWNNPPYRTFRWGADLQVWLPEGREFRSPNNQPDGPEKSILGDAQWRWLEASLKASDATFKAFVSATPVVGPDRGGKGDNHANRAFTHEGEKLRRLLSSIPGCFVVNGDRHWQYHSVDAETGLNEFGCGASTDKHAGGWNPKDKRPEHRFLRVKGGFLSIRAEGAKALVIHHDVDGKVMYETTLP